MFALPTLLLLSSAVGCEESLKPAAEALQNHDLKRANTVSKWNREQWRSNREHEYQHTKKHQAAAALDRGEATHR
jgi:hypothetical protein